MLARTTALPAQLVSSAMQHTFRIKQLHVQHLQVVFQLRDGNETSDRSRAGFLPRAIVVSSQRDDERKGLVAQV